MKAHSCSIILGVGLLTLAGPLKGQIRDTEGSVALLAMNCARSSGYAPSNYEEYCTRLAKTIGVLSGEQQKRVFGYLPTPSGGGLAAEPQTPVVEAPATETPTTSPATTSPTTESSAAAGITGNSGASNLDSNSGSNSGPGNGLIEQVVATANTTVSNTSDTAAPVVDALTGIDLSPTTQAVTNATQSVGSGSSNALQDFWNSVISFFQSLQKR